MKPTSLIEMVRFRMYQRKLKQDVSKSCGRWKVRRPELSNVRQDLETFITAVMNKKKVVILLIITDFVEIYKYSVLM